MAVAACHGRLVDPCGLRTCASDARVACRRAGLRCRVEGRAPAGDGRVELHIDRAVAVGAAAENREARHGVACRTGHAARVGRRRIDVRRVRGGHVRIGRKEARIARRKRSVRSGSWSSVRAATVTGRTAEWSVWLAMTRRARGRAGRGSRDARGTGGRTVVAPTTRSCVVWIEHRTPSLASKRTPVALLRTRVGKARCVHGAAKLRRARRDPLREESALFRSEDRRMRRARERAQKRRLLVRGQDGRAPVGDARDRLEVGRRSPSSRGGHRGMARRAALRNQRPGGVVVGWGRGRGALGRAARSERARHRHDECRRQNELACDEMRPRQPPEHRPAFAESQANGPCTLHAPRARRCIECAPLRVTYS